MTVVGQGFSVAPALEISVVSGIDAVAASAASLSELIEAVPGLPVTARWPWLSASVLKPAPHEQPWLVTVAAGDRLVAAAVLLDDVSGTVVRTSLAGTAENHRGVLLARDDQAGDRLGEALATALMSSLREFSIGPVGQSAALAALLRELPIGVVVDEVSVPVVRTTPGLPSGISRGMERSLRKAGNRMAADGLVPELAVTADGAEIRRELPLLESISRDRDLLGGRPSPLDDPHRRRLWQHRVIALAAEGGLCMATLRFDGELAAYVLGIEDGNAYRILEGRYVTGWARYSPGRVLEAAVLEAVTNAAPLDELDWMTGVAPETLLAANDADRLVLVSGRT
jgi:Acetyltransferase (GNAT) domain